MSANGQPAQGVLELHPKGYGFLRDPARNFAAQPGDAYVSAPLMSRHGLREGLLLSPGKHLLQAEQSFEYARPIVAGDKLTVRSKVVEMSQRNTPSGLTDVVVIEDEGRDETSAVVYRSRQLWVVRTAPKHGPGDLHE